MLTMHRMKQVVIPLIIAVVVAGAVSFYAGMRYGSSPAAASGDSRGGMGTRRLGGGRSQDNFAVGDIIAKDDKSITVSVRGGGGSKIIFFSDATQIMKSAPGALTDLAAGQQITAMGTQNSDGSITAQSIQIRPAMQNNYQPNK